MIGNLEDAELIHRRRWSGAGPTPRGWKKLGEGASRSAYLSPGGIVYKIDNDEDCLSNLREYANYTRLKRLPALPKIEFVDIDLHNFWAERQETLITVNAQHFVPGRGHVKGCMCTDSYLAEMLERLHVYDEHCDNYRLIDGTYYFFDFND